MQDERKWVHKNGNNNTLATGTKNKKQKKNQTILM